MQVELCTCDDCNGNSLVQFDEKIHLKIRLYRTKTSNKAVQVCEAQLNAANLALKGNFFTVCMFLLSPYAKEFPSTWWVKDSMFCLITV